MSWADGAIRNRSQTATATASCKRLQPPLHHQTLMKIIRRLVEKQRGPREKTGRKKRNLVEAYDLAHWWILIHRDIRNVHVMKQKHADRLVGSSSTVTKMQNKGINLMVLLRFVQRNRVDIYVSLLALCTIQKGKRYTMLDSFFFFPRSNYISIVLVKKKERNMCVLIKHESGIMIYNFLAPSPRTIFNKYVSFIDRSSRPR